MATTTPPSPQADLTDAANATVLADAPAVPVATTNRWPFIIILSVGSVLLVGVALLGGSLLKNVVGRTKEDQVKLYEVERRGLLVFVREDGNLESAQNVELKSRVEGVTTILKIVEDGSRVSKGDVLVELDSAQLEEQITQQRIAVNRAEATMVQAQKDLQVATISKQEYAEGTYRQQIQDAEALITIALENLRTAENTLEHTQRMFRKGYVSKLQLESQQFAVKTATLNLKSAETAKEVLEKYTRAKMMEDLQAQIDAARTRSSSEKEAYDLEVAKLKRLEEQLKHCTLIAPQDGMVVYANERSGRFGSQQGVQIEEGASVRERQTILRLPDLSRMQVKVNVHESKVEDLDIGMPAMIKVQDRQFQGEVVSIASQPEPTSWFSGSIKEYATIVRIEGQPKNLKPGMTAEVIILVAELDDVVTVPVSAVVEKGGNYYCWSSSVTGIKKHKLRLGLTNDEYVEIKDGVAVGEKVIRNPLSVVPEAQESESDADKKDGDTKGFGKGNRRGGMPGKGGGRPGGQQRGSGRPGGDKKSGRSMDFSRFDKNGDGAISRDELPAPMQGFFDKMDSNSDGKIDAKEQAELKKRRGRGGSERSGGSERGSGSGDHGRSSGGLMQYDKDGDGKVSKDEAPERLQGMFSRFDTNSDGFIDKSEIEALRSRAKKR